MKKLAIALAVLSALTVTASAERLLESYVARLGVSDHYSSYGARLNNVAAIIRQDRANYHRFNRRDAEDRWDSFFSRKSNRAIMERMLNRGFISLNARRAIVNGTPLIRVNIYRNHVDVQLLSEYRQRSTVR